MEQQDGFIYKKKDCEEGSSEEELDTNHQGGSFAEPPGDWEEGNFSTLSEMFRSFYLGTNSTETSSTSLNKEKNLVTAIFPIQRWN